MRYQKVFTQIWDDEKFSVLSPEAQRFFLYLLTAPASNLIGIYPLKEGYVCEDLKCMPKDFQKWLKEVLTKGLISYDYNHKILLIKKYLKHNSITNPNQLKAAIKAVKALPKTQLLQELKVILQGLQEGLTKGLLEGLLYTATATVTDTDTATDRREKPKIETDTKTDTNKKLVEDVITFLNLILKTKYKPDTIGTVKLVLARIGEGFTLDDFKKVIETKNEEWGGDPKMEKFLRPETLFGTKFESYLNQKGGQNDDDDKERFNFE